MSGECLDIIVLVDFLFAPLQALCFYTVALGISFSGKGVLSGGYANIPRAGPEPCQDFELHQTSIFLMAVNP